ncbi:MAG: hypothetical protein R3E67_04015 [Pseudomonadales bacterium]
MTVGGNTARELKERCNTHAAVVGDGAGGGEFSGQEIGFFIDDRQKTYGFLFFDERTLAWSILEKDSFNQPGIARSLFN